jgi:hypothetical protein
VLIVLRATNILPIMLQKGVSRDSEDESDDGGQSDVSFFSFCIDGFKPHVTTDFYWAYKS